MPEAPDPNLFQMYCDCECSPEQCCEIERQLSSNPDLTQKTRQQQEFNRRLKDRLCAVMGESCTCPAEAMARIEAALAQESAPAVAGRVTPASSGQAASTRRGRGVWAALFENPRRGSAFAIAASIMLVIGAVLYGIFGTTIDELPPQNPRDVFANAALFAETEHSQCAGNEKTLAQKTSLNEVALAEGDLTRWLDAPVEIADLAAQGYEFIGASHCGMPVAPRSGHIVYRKLSRASGPAHMVSVFVFPNRGQCGGSLCEGMACSEWYDCATSQCRHRILRSTDGKLVYVLICCDDGDLESVADALGQTLHRGN